MIDDVKLFNEATGLDEVELNEAQAYKIISSEGHELLEAIFAEDRVAIADALVDIVFATLSCAERLGYPMRDLWDEVVKSNMSKVGAPIIDGKLQKGVRFIEPDFASIIDRNRS